MSATRRWGSRAAWPSPSRVRGPARPAAGAGGAAAPPGARGDARGALRRARRFLAAAAAPRAEAYAGLMEVFPYELRRELVVDEIPVRPTAELLGAPGPGLAGLQRLDLETYLPGDLLVKAHLASLSSSLELRAPLLDHRIVELGLALPDSLKVRGRTGKIALRRAFADDLPPLVAARGKTGFGVPLGRWFRDELGDVAGDLLLDARARQRGRFRPATVERLLAEHRSGAADHGHRLWCLLALELWERAYVESSRPPASPAEALPADALLTA